MRNKLLKVLYLTLSILVYFFVCSKDVYATMIEVKQNQIISSITSKL